MITGILRKPPYEHMISLCASTWQQLAAWHMAMLGFFYGCNRDVHPFLNEAPSSVQGPAGCCFRWTPRLLGYFCYFLNIKSGLLLLLHDHIISYPCVFGWLISSWLKCGDSKWLIFRAAKLGPDLRYRTIIAIEIGDLSWIYPLKMVIFHSYVRLPEGNSSIISISFEGWRRWQ